MERSQKTVFVFIEWLVVCTETVFSVSSENTVGLSDGLTASQKQHVCVHLHFIDDL